jgi:hypothetical protein
MLYAIFVHISVTNLCQPVHSKFEINVDVC